VAPGAASAAGIHQEEELDEVVVDGRTGRLHDVDIVVAHASGLTREARLADELRDVPKAKDLRPCRQPALAPMVVA
jgi:hypothetical protein